MKISHVLMCIGLIAFGICFLCFISGGLFADVTVFSFVGLVLYIPTMILFGVLPIFAGFGYLYEMIVHRHDKE